MAEGKYSVKELVAAWAPGLAEASEVASGCATAREWALERALALGEVSELPLV